MNIKMAKSVSFVTYLASYLYIQYIVDALQKTKTIIKLIFFKTFNL